MSPKARRPVMDPAAEAAAAVPPPLPGTTGGAAIHFGAGAATAAVATPVADVGGGLVAATDAEVEAGTAEEIESADDLEQAEADAEAKSSEGITATDTATEDNTGGTK